MLNAARKLLSTNSDAKGNPKNEPVTRMVTVDWIGTGEEQTLSLPFEPWYVIIMSWEVFEYIRAGKAFCLSYDEEAEGFWSLSGDVSLGEKSFTIIAEANGIVPWRAMVYGKPYRNWTDDDPIFWDGD